MSHRSPSHRHQFSREGFQPLANIASNDIATANPNDITIDIPMTQISSRTKNGLRKPTMSPSSYSPHGDFPSTSEKNQVKPFHRGPGGRRRKIEQRGRENRDKDDGTLNAVGRIYHKIFHFSVFTRYFVYVAPLALLIAIPIVVGATFAPRATIGGVRIVWFFTWIEVIWCSLWISKLVSQFLPHLFQFLCGVVSSGTRKYALMITALEIPLSLVGWALTALTTFVPLMTLNPDQKRLDERSLKPWESIVKNILLATLISSVIFLAEKVLIQLISISYHRKQFDDKIKQSKHNIYLVSLLYDASRVLFPSYCSDFAEEDYLIHDILDIGTSRGAASKHVRSGSLTPMRLIQNVGRVGDKVTAAFGNVAHEVTGKQVFNPTSAHSIVVEAFERKASTEALARRIWMSFVMEGKDALYHEDIADVLGPERSAEADESFAALDVDGNGDISLDEMLLRLNQFSKERYAIANSMHDIDQAINILDNLLCTVVILAVAFVFVAFLNRSLTTTLATAGTALLSLSFVFAGTAQEVLGSIIFIFVKHPFDVGDRVDVADVQLVVERISLLYTLFRRVKDHKKTQVANIVLNTTWIDNISRSNAMRERITLCVNFDTTLEDIDLLKKETQAFVRDKDNSRDFQSEVEVEVTDLAEMNKLQLTIEVRHKSNWAIESIRAARRSKFMCALVLALRKVPIYGPGGGGAVAGDAANPTYSVAISDEQAATNKKSFADAKNKQRMVPLVAELGTTQDQGSAFLGTSLSSDRPGTADTAVEATHGSHVNSLRVATEDRLDTKDEGPRLRKDTTRDSDIEEVRGLLRRASTTGRRRASQQNALAHLATYQSGYQSSLPAIVQTPPAFEPQQTQYFPSPTRSESARPPRVGAYAEADYDDTPANQAAALEYSQSAPMPVETSYRQRGPRPGVTFVPGNAFSYQPYEQREQDDAQSDDHTDPSTMPSRRPVPGIPAMKGVLINNQTQDPR